MDMDIQGEQFVHRRVNDTEMASGPYMGLDDEVSVECGHKPADFTCPCANWAQTNDTVIAAQQILKDMEEFCLGDSWHGRKCFSLMKDFRQLSHQQTKLWASTITEPPTMRTPTMCHAPVHHWRSGGGLRANVKCGPGGKERAFFFRHNYKAAGLSIKANMCHIGGRPWNAARDEDWWEHDRCREYGYLLDNASPMLFTFVRHPIDKFMAGYKELCVRNPHISDLQHFKAGTVGHAKSFLDLVFHSTCDNPHVLAQTYMLMNNRCESKFDFIGKVESLDEDWKLLGKNGGCETPLGWPVNPKHASQDPADEKYESAMVAALREKDNALFKALCWWILSDFVLFDYSLPSECYNDEVLRRTVGMARQSPSAFSKLRGHW